MPFNIAPGKSSISHSYDIGTGLAPRGMLPFSTIRDDLIMRYYGGISPYKETKKRGYMYVSLED